MNIPTDKNIYWNPCHECNGQGRITRQPSKRRRLRYNKELKKFKNIGDEKIKPQPLAHNKDICLICSGSGLKVSDIATPINTNYPRVAIIGGGIGGTALAVACLHRGISFTLYERDKSFNARSQGYGLTLQQASKAIAGLGITSLENGITSTRHVVHDTQGKIIGEWGMRKWIQDPVQENSKRKNIHIARQSLRLALLEQLHKTDSIKWGHTSIDFSKNKEGSIDIHFDLHGKIKKETADLVVGADGIHSSVRSQLINDDQTPLRYLGCIVILGICSLDSLCDIDSPLLDSATVFQTVDGHNRIYMMPYDTHSIMWQLSFPLSKIQAKELHKKGSQAMKDESLHRLKKWHRPILEILIATPASSITGYPIYDRKKIDPKITETFGNVTLIGDAAHPMSPFKGQGANQALLDALSLARMITTHCDSDMYWRKNDLRKNLLHTFEKEMYSRTSSKVQASAEAVTLLHSDAVLHDGNEPRGRGLHKKST